MKKLAPVVMVLSLILLPSVASASIITDFIESFVPTGLRKQPEAPVRQVGTGGVVITPVPTVVTGDTTETYFLSSLASRKFTIENGGSVDLFLNKSGLLRYSATPSGVPDDVPAAFALYSGSEREITISNPSTTTNYFLSRSDLSIVSTGTTIQPIVFISSPRSRAEPVEGGSQSIASYSFSFILNNATDKDIYVSRLIDRTDFVTISPVAGATSSVKFIEATARIETGDNGSAYVVPAGRNREFEITGIVDNTKGVAGSKTLSVTGLRYAHSNSLSPLLSLPAQQLRPLTITLALGAGELSKPPPTVTSTTTTPVVPPPTRVSTTTTSTGTIPPAATSTGSTTVVPSSVRATTTPGLVIISASTTIGSPIRNNGEIVGYPVTFSFTARAEGKAAYISRLPTTAFQTSQSGFGTVLPVITTLSSIPSRTGDGGTHFIISASTTRSFQAFTILKSDGLTRAGTQTFQITKMNYGSKASALAENSTTQNTANLKAVVKLAPSTAKHSTSPGISPSLSSSPTPSPSTSPSSSASPSPSSSASATPSELIALCYAVPTSPETGELVTWQVMHTGGSGTASFSWAGTDSLTGTSASVKKTYNSVGKKNAIVAVVSGNQNVTASCYTTIVASSPSPSPTPSSTASPAASPSTQPDPEPDPPAQSGAPSPSSSGGVSVRELSNRGMVAAAFYSLGEFLDSLFAR